MQTPDHTHTASAASAVPSAAFTLDAQGMARRGEWSLSRGKNADATDALVTRWARC